MKIYDFIGIGIGPFNLGLAALAHNVEGLNCLFFDKNEKFEWHPGMMLDNATLQVPFMADLVTMADPSSPFSFLNYLKKNNRIYKFYIRESFYILRQEYNNYCQWALAQLPSCRFGKNVSEIEHIPDADIYRVKVVDNISGEEELFYTQRLVFATGTQPYMPPFIDKHPSIIHSSAYLGFKVELLKKNSVTLVGSGQSAAEIFMDLLQSRPADMQLNWFTRSDRFFPMEYSKLTLELTSPEYVDHFYGLPASMKEKVLSKQNMLYKGINYDLINEIYDQLYQQSVSQDELKVNIGLCSELTGMSTDSVGNIVLNFTHIQQETSFEHVSDAVVLATGYKYKLPGFIRNIKDRISWDEKGRFEVQRNYAIDSKGNELFVQNAELHTHGFVTPDLGMGAYRNSVILNSILGYEHYPVEKSIAFQTFSVPESELAHDNEPAYYEGKAL